MKWILLIAVFSLTQVSAFADKKKGSTSNTDPIVAKVNGVVIKKSTLLSYHKQNLNFVQNKKVVSLENSLNDLIDRIVGIGAAKKNGTHKRPDVVKKMNDIIYHAYISDVLTPKLKTIKVAEKEVDAYYKKFPEYKTSQILLRVRTLPSKEEMTETLMKADRIYTEAIKNPKAFASLAKQYGQTSTAPTGGDMGYLPKVKLPQQYYSAIKGKKNGYISNPIRTQYGISIIMVTGVKELKQIERKTYKKIIYDTKRDKILAKYFATKRKSSKVKIYQKELKYE